jgi:hypothetical protein
MLYISISWGALIVLPWTDTTSSWCQMPFQAYFTSRFTVTRTCFFSVYNSVCVCPLGARSAWRTFRFARSQPSFMPWPQENDLRLSSSFDPSRSLHLLPERRFQTGNSVTSARWADLHSFRDPGRVVGCWVMFGHVILYEDSTTRPSILPFQTK